MLFHLLVAGGKWMSPWPRLGRPPASPVITAKEHRQALNPLPSLPRKSPLDVIIPKLKRRVERMMHPPPEHRGVNAERNAALLKSLGGQVGILLDSGCGSGEGISHVREAGAWSGAIIGLDITYGKVREAQSRDGALVTYVCGDAINSPFAGNSIDAVLSSQVIEHLHESDRYVAEIARVLKPGGILAISTPNAHCPRNVLLRLLGQKPILRWSNADGVSPKAFRGHVKEFRQTELIDLARCNGFVVQGLCPVLPSPTTKGNWLYSVYSVAEYAFYRLTRPFVERDYSKNINIVFRLRGQGDPSQSDRARSNEEHNEEHSTRTAAQRSTPCS